MNYTKRIVKGTAIVFTFSLISAVVGYLMRIFIARKLGPYEYGLFFGTFAIISFIALFGNLGLDETIAKFVAEFKVKNRKDKITSIILLSLMMKLFIFFIILLIIFSLADVIAIEILNNQKASIILKLLTLSIFLTSLLPTFQSALRGLGKIKQYSFVSFLFIFITFLSALLLVPGSKEKTISLAYCYIIGALISGLASFIFFIKSFPRFLKFKISIDRDLIERTILFAIPTFAYSIAYIIISYTDTIMLSVFRTIQEVGLYQVVIPTARMILYFSMALSTILLPVFSEMWAKGEKKGVGELLFRILKISLVLAIPLSLIFIMFPSIVLNVLFGHEYVSAATPLRILAIGYLFYILSTIHFNLMNGIGKPILTTKIVYASAGLNVILNFILIPHIGIVGAAIASMTSFTFSFILSEIILYREFNKMMIQLNFPIKSFFKTLACGVITIIIIQILKGIIQTNPILETIIISFISFTIYFIAIFRFGALTIRDLAFIKEINLPVPKSLIKLIKIVAG